MAFAGYVFDAYGTLFDVHSAVRTHAQSLGEQGNALSETWRNKQLEYAWIKALMGSYSDFWTLTEEALDYALASQSIEDSKLRDALLEAYWTLDCYPEVPKALKRLRKDGARTAILTNGSPDMIRAAVESSKIDALVDDIFCVEAVKTFKTAPEVYAMVTDSWDVKPKKVAFHSSNRWDIAGATKFGFRCSWINRNGQPDEYKRYPPERVLESLKDI